MPTGTFERKSPFSVAATPASVNATPGKTSNFSENRKSSKPIMEKRRRARINESLGQLKTLILAALKKDSSRHSKLEKADILEMTVKHLRNLQRIQMTAGENTDVHVPGKYRAGFSACVDEVTRFLSACEGVTVDVRSHLLGHLAACVARVAQAHAAKLPAQQRQQLQLHLPGHGLTGAQPPSASLQVPGGGLCKSVSATNVRPDAVKVFGGFQVMPTADGQFALLLPSAALAPWSGQSAHPSMAPVISVVVPQAATSPDSMWRPW